MNIAVGSVGRTTVRVRMRGWACFGALSVLGGAASGWVIGDVARSLSGNRMAPWILGRSAGVTSYLLLVLLVLSGLLLAHPARSRVRWPGQVARIRLHAALAGFACTFAVLHVVVLATDRFAGVGWWGVLLPLGAVYRPIPVTFGVLGMWAGAVAGGTASLARWIPGRVWWPLHRLAFVSVVSVWVHAVLAGSDSRALLTLYIASGAVVAVAAMSRLSARTPAERAAAAVASRRTPRLTRAGGAA